MIKDSFNFHSNGLWRSGVRMMYAAALGLTLAIPASAEDRAIRSKVPPVYPEIAKRMRITGEVKLAVTVDADGKVTDVKPVSGNRSLSQAAEDAVRKWKFESGAGTSTVEVSMNFAL